jgi:hypothetical protein
MRFIGILMLCILTVMALSCKKEKQAEALDCYLDTAPSDFVEESISVTYTLTASGDFNVTQFYYHDESGRVELSNPSTPQEITVVLTNQRTMVCGARGSVKNGFIEVEYLATSSQSTYNSSTKCEQSSQ